jgi:predicted transcriptional regulator
MNKNKIFTFKYDPTISLKRMGEEMLEAVKINKPSISQHQISFANIKDITEEFISPRPKLFACIVENEPLSLYQLAKLLKRDYANVYKDVQNLVAMGVIKLEKEDEITGNSAKQRIKPIPLYNQIVFDFRVKKVFPEYLPLEKDFVKLRSSKNL